MKKTFYQKLGGRYVAVSEFDSELTDALPRGTHLVSVYPGGKSTRYNVDPNYAAMIAAGRVAQEAVCEAIVKAQELRPQRTPITEQQQALWRALAHSFGQENYPLIRPAARDAAEAAVQAMQAEAEALMTHPAVREAFERFQTVCNLVKQKSSS